MYTAHIINYILTFCRIKVNNNQNIQIIFSLLHNIDLLGLATLTLPLDMRFIQ